MSHASAASVRPRTGLASALLTFVLVLALAQPALAQWRAPGSLPLSDSDAASQVSWAAEVRWGNHSANNYWPSDEELDAFRHGQRDRYGRTAVEYNPLAQYVTGRFAGTTDEILQWAAHKWGIPEDIVRAVAVGESWWNMSQLGDRRDNVDAQAYPPYARINPYTAYQSLGIMQINWTPAGLHTGTDPLRWKSTAFNVDYWASTVRYYFDGYCDWCYPDYDVGQEWESVAAWQNPWPWKSADSYISYIQQHVWNRTWLSPWFN